MTAIRALPQALSFFFEIVSSFFEILSNALSTSVNNSTSLSKSSILASTKAVF